MAIMGGASGIVGAGFIFDSNGGQCCCCKNCCFKFCGDEQIVDGLGDLVNPHFAIAGDTTYKIKPNSQTLKINNQPIQGLGFCGIVFEFTAIVWDANLGTECEAPAKMWLCSQDHRPQGLLSCVCECHWHVEVEECDSGLEFCGGDGDCDWEWDGNQWVKTKDCEGDCGCPVPEGDGIDVGDLASTFCSPNDFPARDYVGGDGCLDAACDAPNCGDCKTFDNAYIYIVDPDYSVRCCCLNAYDVGEV